MSRKEILKKLKEKIQNKDPGTCDGCPLFIYANTYLGKSLYEIDCISDCMRLFKILNLKFQERKGCVWLHNYILNIESRETVKI